MTLVLSLTFIPAVVVLTGLQGKVDRDDPWPARLGSFAEAVGRRRRSVAVLLGLIAVAGVASTGRVDTRMDTRAFYSEGSLPDRSEVFLQRHFGGSQFAQLSVRGDLKQPEVLRELGRLGDTLSLVPQVTGVSEVAQVVSIVNDAMEGARRIPDTPGKVRTLLSLMAGQAGTRKLITDERDEALVWLKLGTVEPADLEAAVDAIEASVAVHYPGGTRSYATAAADGHRGKEVAARRRELVASRLTAIAHRHGLAPLDAVALVKGLAAPAPALRAGAEVVAETARAYLRGKEALVELPPAADGVDPAALVGAAAAALGPAPSEDALLAATATARGKPTGDMTAGDVAFSLESVLSEAWRDVGAAGRIDALAAQLGIAKALAAAPVVKAEMATALMDLASPTAMVSSPPGSGQTIKVSVTGLPVLYRGLSRSVTANQFRSLAFALGLVLLIMVVVFRSITGGILATVPTALTLLVIYGVMGAMDVHLDIGTSMLASIIIGTGVDYGVHLLDAWRAEEGEPLEAGARRGAAHAGPAIWTNALAVCAGFFVLTLGDARPLQNVGALTAAAMLTAAATTFLAIPALARRRAYSPRPDLASSD